MCCRSEWQERMYIYKWHEVDQTKHEIFCVHIVCNEIQVKVNLEITTSFFICVFHTVPTFLIWGCIKLLLLLLLLGGLLLLGYQIAPLFHLSAALHTHAQMRNKVYLGRPPTVLITSFSSWLADSRAPRPSAGNFLRPRKSSWWYCACVELVRPHSSSGWVYFECCVDAAVRETERKAESEVYPGL